MNEKETIEAALFAAGGALDAQTLGKIIGKPANKTVATVETLMKEYSERESGIEIIDLGHRYVMQVKPMFTDLVRPVAPKELSAPMLRTLAMIAYHQPVVQSDLVDMRGNTVYDHIRELTDRGLIMSVPYGRTKKLQTTPLFADYFGLSSNEPEAIKQKIIELSRQQSGDKGLSKWLGCKVVAFTPMYQSLAILCGIEDYKVINAYDPTEEEIEELADVSKLVISKGYLEKVSRYYDGEIIEVGSTTFDDLVEAVKALENIGNSQKVELTLSNLRELKERYVSKALLIDRKVKPATDMVARIVNDLRLGVSAEGVVIAPDYGLSSSDVQVSEGADILVPTHKSVESDIIERVCRKYDAIIDGLKGQDIAEDKTPDANT
ncbi:SMC-Scp complex subunit ScpB [uncultured Methanomethylovorans sp.]|uniref:SMC-Scp complex subunit ScpB n=1 Tax=uncultured Methanomethylovorans sp. TaxID=183759 RepID=UPI002AA92BDE|nr:SMC-Scp complex subunit ScpB [uncultured Methanomethylovorans sp.]